MIRDLINAFFDTLEVLMFGRLARQEHEVVQAAEQILIEAAGGES